MTALIGRRAVAATAAAAVLTLSGGIGFAAAEPTPSPTPTPSDSAPADQQKAPSPDPSGSASPQAPDEQQSTAPTEPDDSATVETSPEPDASTPPASTPPPADDEPSNKGEADKPNADETDRSSDADTPTPKDRTGAKFRWDDGARSAAASGASKGQSVEADKSAENLASALVGHGVEISNAEFTGHAAAAGTFDGFADGVGIGSGVALSSGSVIDSDGATSSLLAPNDGTGNTTMGTPGDSQLSDLVGDRTHDAAVLEFDFTAAGSEIEFSYVFGSEEYPEYVGQDYNDVFALSVNGSNCALIPGTDQAVSINNVNADRNAHHFRDNYTDPDRFATQLDGMTQELRCSADVAAGETNHIRLAIADTADDWFDSSVLIKANSVQVPTPPTVDDKSYSIYNMGTAEVELTGEDVNGEDLTFDVEQQPEHGALTGTGANLTYTPDQGYVGTDSFSYVANDGEFDSDPATVMITVLGNDPAVGKDDSYTTEFETALIVNAPGVLENDSDADADDIKAVHATQPANGSLKLTMSGKLTYAPQDGFSGKDTFTYQIDDGYHVSDPVTVTVTVQDPPSDAGRPGLSNTGSDVSPSLIIFSAAALVAGVGALIIGRRLRRRSAGF